MQKGVRWIGGKEYMLAGRCDSKKRAKEQAAALRESWASVRIVKLWDYDFMLYVHGGTHTSRIS
jgi:hypothetical protein